VNEPIFEAEDRRHSRLVVSRGDVDGADVILTVCIVDATAEEEAAVVDTTAVDLSAMRLWNRKSPWKSLLVNRVSLAVACDTTPADDDARDLKLSPTEIPLLRRFSLRGPGDESSSEESDISSTGVTEQSQREAGNNTLMSERGKGRSCSQSSSFLTGTPLSQMLVNLLFFWL